MCYDPFFPHNPPPHHVLTPVWPVLQEGPKVTVELEPKVKLEPTVELKPKVKLEPKKVQKPRCAPAPPCTAAHPSSPGHPTPPTFLASALSEFNDDIEMRPPPSKRPPPTVYLDGTAKKSAAGPTHASLPARGVGMACPSPAPLPAPTDFSTTDFSRAEAPAREMSPHPLPPPHFPPLPPQMSGWGHFAPGGGASPGSGLAGMLAHAAPGHGSLAHGAPGHGSPMLGHGAPGHGRQILDGALGHGSPMLGHDLPMLAHQPHHGLSALAHHGSQGLAYHGSQGLAHHGDGTSHMYMSSRLSQDRALANLRLSHGHTLASARAYAQSTAAEAEDLRTVHRQQMDVARVEELRLAMARASKAQAHVVQEEAAARMAAHYDYMY